jgi:UDP-N-acetyl-D-galactosamine dehydrogenase
VDDLHPVDALIVAVGHNSYRALNARQLRSYCRHPTPVLADIKSLYDRDELAQAGFTVYRL